MTFLIVNDGIVLHFLVYLISSSETNKIVMHVLITKSIYTVCSANVMKSGRCDISH